MKYIGNKFRLLDFIDSVVAKDGLPTKGTFIDIFTGTTNVAKHYKKKGYRLIANDFMTNSYVFQNAYIKNNEYPTFEKVIEAEDISPVSRMLKSKDDSLSSVIHYINGLPGKEGFIFEN